ncbi:hypothetical protein JQS43_00375 [Natronosporangium hydrolyticum]|uniref:DUF6457 domain-containing protein n=1 Tax=Natronosporangium hydrolyticum TaxID=2811111 RepID=A0A895YLX6_9ACTN|nr:DUF6457 domain-containing protein [Natronosporangium hydrolyticum]QSB14888.1 hypothetical protein JQS43_00375 [Natronosporangium hydrolyticum]
MSNPRTEPGQPAEPDPLAEWMDAASQALGLTADSPDAQQRRLLLAVARDVAHAVARPAAPLSTFLLGVAVGRGADPEQAAAALAGLARDWPDQPAPDEE